MRHELTHSSRGKRLDRSPVQAPTPTQLDAGRNVLSPAATGWTSPTSGFGEALASTVTDFYRGGLTAGARAGRDFLEQVPLTDQVKAEKFSAALKRSIALAFARMKTAGARGDDLAAWSAGFVTGLVPYALAWNFGDANNG
jgi:hypothetical protein